MPKSLKQVYPSQVTCKKMGLGLLRQVLTPNEPRVDPSKTLQALKNSNTLNLGLNL